MLSVVIAALDAEATLGDQLESLAHQDFVGSWELVVADNGSRDGTRAVVERYRERIPSMVLVDASARRGQAYARNLGVDRSKGDSILFLDADDQVTPNYLTAMAAALMDHDLVASRVECDSLNEDWTKPSLPPPQTEGVPVVYAFLPAAAGGTLGVRRDLFCRLGGFDETLPPSEDADLCWRAQQGGSAIHFAGDAVLRFRYRTSLTGFLRRGYREGSSLPLLYKRHKQKGMGRRGWKSVLRFHLGALRSLATARSRGSLAYALEMIGLRAGLLRGSFSHRVLYL